MATCRIRKRDGDTIGEPKVIDVMYSEWIKPFVFLSIGLTNKPFSAVFIGKCTRW